MGLSWLHVWSTAHKLKEWVGVEGVRVVSWCNGEGEQEGGDIEMPLIPQITASYERIPEQGPYFLVCDVSGISICSFTRSSGQND